jgi:hypothetical protein
MMRSNATNTLTYTGIVTLSQYNEEEQIIREVTDMNRGGNQLFSFLADCLSGAFDTAALNMPAQIMLLNITIDESGNEVISKAHPDIDFVRLLTNPEKVYVEDSANMCAVKYSFLIPSDFLTGTNFNAIGLYKANTSDLNNYVACVSVGLTAEELSVSTLMVVDWELIISNKNK